MEHLGLELECFVILYDGQTLLYDISLYERGRCGITQCSKDQDLELAQEVCKSSCHSGATES